MGTKKIEGKTLEQTIHSLKPMIVKIAKGYQNQFEGSSFSKVEVLEDLMQEGALAITRAWAKFDNTKKTKFSSFAFFYIRQHIQMYIASTFGVCKQPHTKISNSFRGLALDSFDFDTCDNNLGIVAELDTSEMDITSTWESISLGVKSWLTPAESNMVFMFYGISTTDLFPKLKPMKDFLVRTALTKLNRKLKDFSDLYNI